MSNHIAKLLSNVLKGYDVSVTYRTIEQTILAHPEYPSMQCISDALDTWRIKHIVLKLSIEKLRDLNVPVIAHLKKGDFIWIDRITEAKVHYYHASGKRGIENLSRFEQEWSGVILAIEDVTDAGEPDYKKKHNREIKEKIFKSFIVGSFVILLSVLTYFSWISDSSLLLLPKLLLLIINAIGCYISYILIRQEKSQSNALSNKFCKVGKYIDCKKVTSSKYSTLFGFISWAELGAACFGSMALWIMIAPLSNGWLPPLWWFSLAALPFTLWSLMTQAFVIRKWCLFCCSVVILLWANAAILIIYSFQPAILSIPDVAMAVLLFITCLVAVIEKSKTIGIKDYQYAKQRETAKIKYDPLTIQAHLSETTQPIEKTGFSWGNADSSHDIGLYVSISCPHCGTAVKELRRLTEIYPNFNYRLIFAVNSDDLEDKANVIICYLTNLYKIMNKDAFFDALDIWYSIPDKSLEFLQKTFPAASNQDCKTEMDALYQFSQQIKIGYTPAILLNGRLLSRIYSYNDLYGIARTINAED